MALDFRQAHYRFGNDDGTEATHTFKANEDTDVTLAVDTPFLLRFIIQEVGGTQGLNLVQQFQYNKNAAGWVNITTSSTIVKAVAVAAFTNGQDCTHRLTGTGTFEGTAAGCTEDGNSGGNTNDVGASGCTETEAGLQIVGADVVDNDSIQFRLTISGPTTTIGYNVTPTATVSMPSSSPSASVSLSQSPSSSVSPSVSPSVSSSVSPSVSKSASPSSSVSPSVSPSVSKSVSPSSSGSPSPSPSVGASTIDQEGFRWRNDDGDETTATWRQTQDTNDSVAKDTNIRIRFLLNATGDPVSKNFKIQYKLHTDSLWTDLTVCSQGPLFVSGTNSRYYTDNTGKAIFLTGSNYWNIMQDGGRTNPPPAFDYTAFLDFAQARGFNYAKPHLWEHAWHQSAADDWYIQPQIYSRPGPANALDGDPKFDVTVFNQDFFDTLRARVIEAGSRGIYVVVPFFDRFSVHDGNTMSDQWLGHPYNSANNINSINGDPTATGHGLDVETLYISAITTLQETWVEKLIDELNDLDNVIWEICMEPWGDYVHSGFVPEDWVDHFIDYVHTYELSKPKQHPIHQGVFFPVGNGDLTYLLASNAESVSPNAAGGYDNDCAYQAGTKVLMVDTDHIAWTQSDVADWAWKCFLRGAGGFIKMDGGYSTYDDQGGGEVFGDAEVSRYNMGKILEYSQTVDLINMLPQNGGTSPCSTGYCLHKTGEYLCESDNVGSNFTIDLTGDIGTFDLEWFRLSDYSASSGGTVAGNGNRTLNPPFNDFMIAYLKVQ